MANLLNENETLAVKILRDNLLYDYQGLVNGINDGEIEMQEWLDNFDYEILIQSAEQEFNKAYKNGYLTNNMNGTTLEIKHINFSGKDKKKLIFETAAVLAFVKLDNDWKTGNLFF